MTEKTAIEDDPLAETPQSSELPTPVSGLSRRRFTQAGLGVSGAVLTLASRSVLAGRTGGPGGGGTCKSPSGFLSGNASQHGPAPICEGRSPEYWKGQQQWPIARDTSFRNLFNCKPNSVYAKYTIGDLITPKNIDQYGLAMHLIAARLNARRGWTPFLTEDRIQSMFREWEMSGTFTPSAGVKWSAAQIVFYLQATQR